MICNGENDCGDNTDETLGCNGRFLSENIELEPISLSLRNICLILPFSFSGTCPSSNFRCQNRRCVQYSRVCDGFNDCQDNSDEEEGCTGWFGYK